VVLQDHRFVVRELEDSLARTPYSVVHIASHGEFSGDPDESFLLTYDGRLDMDGLEQLIKLSRFRDEPVELLTLSACRTAAGDDRAALGLAGVAVKAGARSALATLWFINDQASSLLVTEFYRQLSTAPTPSKARALQLAQRTIKADLRYRHPAYWSPFLMIGNWL
jgi:CHAT domain-containing protein